MYIGTSGGDVQQKYVFCYNLDLSKPSPHHKTSMPQCHMIQMFWNPQSPVSSCIVHLIFVTRIIHELYTHNKYIILLFKI